MYNLNEQILNWRNNLKLTQSLETIDIDELESHLRDEIQKLTQSELSEQEAFWVASHRLGQVESLSDEFAKINSGIIWRKRICWAGMIILIWIMTSYIRNTLSQIIFSLAVIVGIRGYGLNIVNLFSDVMLFVMAVWIVFIVVRMKNINHRFHQIINNVWGKVILLISVLVITVVTVVLAQLSSVVMVRLLGAQEFGQIAIFKSLTSFVWRIFLPMILLLGIILIRPTKLRKSET